MTGRADQIEKGARPGEAWNALLELTLALAGRPMPGGESPGWRSKRSAFWGGTFDPVHFGHLRTAQELLYGLALAEIRFVPCWLPPHRPAPVAPESLRLRMLEAAVDGVPGLKVDDRELNRAGPSYMVDTLISLRADLGSQPLCLILGFDAFLGLPTWHRWHEIPDLAHLVVARRPGFTTTADGELGDLLRARVSQDSTDLHKVSAGRIVIRDVTRLEISASAIRSQVAVGGDPRFLLPDAVRDLIIENRIYENQGEVRTSAQ
ncbi:MAG: nicotinate-nucleotide adenylyltransferase [Gammaproteobacteria bacterium]